MNRASKRDARFIQRNDKRFGERDMKFKEIVIVAFIHRVKDRIYGGVTLKDLSEFSGKTETQLRRMRDAEEGDGVECRVHGSNHRQYYTPSKVALADALLTTAFLTSLCETWPDGKGGVEAITRCDANRETGNAYGRGRTTYEAVLACHEDKRLRESN
jgi:hypothetical protein